jgi:DNA polymerase-4
MVARRLRQHGVRARTVTLKYRDEDFHTSTRAKTLDAAVDSGDALFEAAWRLFRGVHGRRKVRLVGVSASGLAGPAQMALFAAAPSSRSDVARDLVEQRFGEGTLTRASLLAAETLRPVGAPSRGDGDKGGTVQDRTGSRRLRR